MAAVVVGIGRESHTGLLCVEEKDAMGEWRMAAMERGRESGMKERKAITEV